MTMPSFLCIGATKAGTTWLHDQLSAHPGICMPVVKELHYFSAVHVPAHKRWALQTVDRAFKREARLARRRAQEGDADARETVRHLRRVMTHEMFSEDWYRACFERPGAASGVVGEITPAYAELPDQGIAHLLQLLPGVRLIHLLRHPLDRAMSHLRMAAHRREVEPTEAALTQLIDGNPQIFERGAYERQIPRWRAAVPAERLQYLAFGRIRREPQALLREVEAFVGAPTFEAYPTERQVNSTRAIEVPETVVERMRERVQPSVEFLRAEFGDEFLQSTR